MIKKLQGKSLQIFYQNEKIQLPIELEEKINRYWQKTIQITPQLWNGELFLVTDYEETQSEIKIMCHKSNYAHYIYAEKQGIAFLQHTCNNLSGGAVLETLDGFYIVGQMGDTTSYPSGLQEPGGNVDKQDVKGHKIDILKTIKREVKEEINIDLDNKQQVKEYQLKYMTFPEEKECGFMIFAKGKLNMTAKEIEQHFKEYKKYLEENELEVEFETIHLISKKDIKKELEKMPNVKRKYLETLLEADSKEKKI